MSKNKGTHGRGKEPTEEPDEFVQRVTSLSDHIQPHLKKIIAAVVVIIAVLGVMEFIKYQHDNKAKEATEAYASALKIVDAQIVGADDVDPNEDSPVPVLIYPSEEERRTAALSSLSAVAGGDMAMTTLANLRMAKLLLDEGKYDEAIAAYKKFAAGPAPEPLRMSALEGVGYSLEAKAMSNEDPAARQSGLEAALVAFTELQPAAGAPMRDSSLYHQGRILVALGKNDEGIAKFKELLSEMPDSKLATAVEARLASLDAGDK